MVKLDLKKLITDLRGYPGITRKLPIVDVVRTFPQFSSQGLGMKVLADFGEDAAVLSLSEDSQNEGVLLLAADGIMAVLMDADPFWAGYCSVLVNLHDIAAMGGIPLALVDVLSVKDQDVLSELTRGMSDASSKFGVPIVGGHVHPDTEYNAVDVAVLGIARRAGVIYSHTAEIGDSVIFAMDLAGRIHPNAKFAWDTTLDKPPDVVRRQLLIMSELGNTNLVHSGKDISNPGILGTLGMLLESSKNGARIDLDKIPWPGKNKVEFTHWLKVYQGCGFVVTCKPNDTVKVIEKFGTVGLTGQVSGSIIEEKKLIIEHKKKSGVLFDFTTDKITGIQ
jgi:putative methanogenesis marker protein 2